MRFDLRLRPIVTFSLLLAAVGCDGPPPTVGPERLLKGHAKEVTALAFAPDGKRLASRSSDGVKVWDLEGAGDPLSITEDGSDFGSVAFSPDGRTVGANRSGVGAVAWDAKTGAVRAEYREAPAGPKALGGAVAYGWGLRYSPDGKTLAGGGSHLGEDGFVTFWDVSTGEARLGASYRSPVTTVDYSPDGKTLAVGSMSGSVDLIDPASGQVRSTLEASRAYLAPVVFSADGLTLATATDDRTVRLWDVAGGRQEGTLKAHMKGLFSVAFHPGGRVLASGDAGGTIFLWNLASRRPIARLEGHRGKVWSVAFGPDGRWLASAGEDKAVRLWDVSGAIRDAGLGGR